MLSARRRRSLRRPVEPGGRPARRSSGRLPALLFYGLFTGFAWAHTTLLPHHGEDFADLATGNDKRGVVLIVTLVFLGGLVALGAFVYRHSRQPRVAEDTNAAQRRLKETLIQVAAAVRPLMGMPEREMLRAVESAYARAARAQSPPERGSGTVPSFRVGSDSVTVRYDPPSLELVAVSESGGARVVLSERGDVSIGTFVPRTGTAS